MKALLITIFLLSATWCNAQLSTNQKKQVTTMIATATNPLITDIALLKTQVKQLQDSIKSIRATMIPYNKLTFVYPLEAIKDSVNAFTIKLKQ